MNSCPRLSERGLLEALGAIIALVVGTAALFRPAGESQSTGLFALLLALMVGASIIDHRSAHRSNTHNRGSKSQSELGPWYLGVAIPGPVTRNVADFFYVGVRTRRGIWVLWGGIYLTAVLVVIYGLTPNAPRVGAGEGLSLRRRAVDRDMGHGNPSRLHHPRRSPQPFPFSATRPAIRRPMTCATTPLLAAKIGHDAARQALRAPPRLMLDNPAYVEPALRARGIAPSPLQMFKGRYSPSWRLVGAAHLYSSTSAASSLSEASSAGST